MAGQQQEEIETIRSRTIEVKLSDADVKRISEKAAAHGLTVGELIENFIGDLVCGTYSNGSDERMYAEQWFERCWFAVYPLDMNIYGVKYSVGFVTSVCTYPEYTGHGIMKRLMIQSLIRMRDAHKSFALLYPYSIPLYRGLGWEIISNKMTYTIKDTQIPRKLNEPGYVRRVSWDDKEFKELHTKFAEKTHGCLYRNNLAWEEYWRWDEDDTSVAIYYSKDDVPYGYMVYMISSDVMHVKEMIYLNREAQLGLWEFIHAHDSMIDEVRGNNYYSEPIAFELDDSGIRTPSTS